MAENLATFTELPWAPPQEFDGYEVRGALGRGGMGEVYLAHDKLLDRLVAIKFIRAARGRARELCLNEARANAKLQHPNVVAIYRVGEIEERPYIVSEYVRGRSLNQLDLPLPWQRALELGIGLVRGLSAAHRRGILHRDLKLSNAILGSDNDVKLLDFGLAKILEHASTDEELLPVPNIVDQSAGASGGESHTTLDLDGRMPKRTSPKKAVAPTPPMAAATPAPPIVRPPESQHSSLATEASVIAGTPVYMAPEVLRGEPASMRSDIYSMGALLYALCTRDPPFRGLPLLDLVRVVNETDALSLLDAASGMDPGFAATVDRCLRRNPEERYGTADELREALEALHDTGQRASVPEGNPYRGLLPFESTHRSLFFGRRSEVGTIVERLRTEPSLLIVGDSGSGKSSLVRAGVLPLLSEGVLDRHRSWQLTAMVPGRHPHAALLHALRELLGHSRVQLLQQLKHSPRELGRELHAMLGEKKGAVLLVDQLEELVTQSDAAEAEWVAEALGSLIGGSSGFRLLMTARADHLARLSALPGLGEEISRAFYLLRPLSPEKLREVIVGPARCKGVRFESEALLDRLVEGAAYTDGGLPLLQFALAELWEARSGDVITEQAMLSIGGVEGALARHADHVLSQLSPAQRNAARRILLSLLNHTGTRKRRGHDELLQGNELAREALEKLVQGRLVVAREALEGASYELAHEALIKGWTTLRTWIERQGERRAIYQRLSMAAREWRRLERQHEGLWAQRQLDEAASLDSYELNPLEIEFLQASERQVRRQKWGRLAAISSVPVLGALLGLGVWMILQRAAYRQVTELVAEGRTYLHDMRNLDHQLSPLQAQSFLAFDQQRLDDGERLWSEVLKKRRQRQRAQTNALAFVKSANQTMAKPRQDVLGFSAEVYAAIAEIAESEHDHEQLAFALRRIHRMEPTTQGLQLWNAPGKLSVRTTPLGTEVHIQQYNPTEDKHRRLGEERSLGRTPLLDLPVAPGSYLLTLRTPERDIVYYPMELQPGAAIEVNTDIPRPNLLPADFVFIPDGEVLFGTYHDEEIRSFVMQTVPIHKVHVPAFLMSRHEITYRQWLTYLRATQLKPPPELQPSVSANAATATADRPMLLTLRPDGKFQLLLRLGPQVLQAIEGEPLVYSTRSGEKRQRDWLALPVSGVLPDEAMAFAAWLNTTNHPRWARLCNELEWERAARGADDREFPHGDVLAPGEANYFDTYGGDVSDLGLDEVGAHPATRSPFGIDDLSGNVAEWTISTLRPEQFLLRGGNFFSQRNSLRISTRQPADPNRRDIGAGLRICAGL
jgi:serine/threonine protein kinase/formylglycine-generating enzyme required for sulfatase activity